MGVKSTENLPLVVFPTFDFPLELLLSVLQILIHFGYRFSDIMEVFEFIAIIVLLNTY